MVDPPWSTLSYGPNLNYVISMRALLGQVIPTLEMSVCFPAGTWFGLGFGGLKMTDTEQVYFMGTTDSKNQKVLSLRYTERSDRPNNFPTDSPIYQRVISTCGQSMIQFNVSRPLDTSKNPLGNGEQTFVIGQETDVIVAGTYTTFADINNVPTHTGSGGFYDDFIMTINADGTVKLETNRGFYIAHGFVLWAAWGLLGLL